MGYPIDDDPTFTNQNLLGTFLQVILSCADTGCLWDFNAVDLSIVFAPLLDYADLVAEAQNGRGPPITNNPLASLGMDAIEWMQDHFTFKEALDLSEELDSLGTDTVWVKWFEFVRYSEVINTEETRLKDSDWYPWVRTHIIGKIMMFAMKSGMVRFISPWWFLKLSKSAHGFIFAGQSTISPYML